MYQENNYQINYQLEEINVIWSQINHMLRQGQYTISQRDKNIQFADEYMLGSDKILEILLSLKIEDYCYSVRNHKPKYEYEVLHIFGKELLLDSWGEIEQVEIYIKFNVLSTSKLNNAIVISFHKAEYALSYPFK